MDRLWTYYGLISKKAPRYLFVGIATLHSMIGKWLGCLSLLNQI